MSLAKRRNGIYIYIYISAWQRKDEGQYEEENARRSFQQFFTLSVLPGDAYSCFEGKTQRKEQSVPRVVKVLVTNTVVRMQENHQIFAFY
jgi:hypothetical protein